MRTRLLAATAAAALVGTAAPGLAASFLIDNFDDIGQVVYDAPEGTIVQTDQFGPSENILGKYRDLHVNSDSSTPTATELRTTTEKGSTILTFNNAASVTGRGWVTYDGINEVTFDADAQEGDYGSVDVVGLGGVDFLKGGGTTDLTGFLFDIFDVDMEGLYIEIRAWDMDSKDGDAPDAVYSERLPAGGGNPFVSFANPRWSFNDGMNWRAVGALQFFAQTGPDSDIAALDGAIDSISIDVIPLPAPALLLLGGLGGLGALRLRKRKA